PPARGRLERRLARGRQLLGPGRPLLVGRAVKGPEEPVLIRGLVRFLDERSGTAPFLKQALRYVFPDHWSFLLGEVALYAFVILVGTGIYLTLFFEPSTATTYYTGHYLPLRGHEMSVAYRSAVDLSFKVRAGLLMRQTHHWAADVFVASIVLHMLRIFFTGAFRKPRDLTYYLGLTILIATLLGLHLFLVAARHHTQFRESRRTTEKKVIGIPTFPGQAPRSLGLFFAVAAVLFLLGGLIQINPIWLWGPYHVAQGTNGAQPDWYLGWLIGPLRLVPSLGVTSGHYTVVPNPFWGGAAFPLVVFAILFAWPALERRVTGDRGVHNLLDRPRDVPWRTAIGAALFAWVALVFLFGAADRVYASFGVSYTVLVWV